MHNIFAVVNTERNAAAQPHTKTGIAHKYNKKEGRGRPQVKQAALTDKRQPSVLYIEYNHLSTGLDDDALTVCLHMISMVYFPDKTYVIQVPDKILITRSGV